MSDKQNATASTAGGLESGEGGLANLLLDRLDKINTDLTNIRTDIGSLKLDVQNSFKKINKEVNKCKKDISAVRKDNVALKQQISFLNQQMSDCTQIPFVNMVKIDNIPTVENENLLTIITLLSGKIKFELSEDMIETIFRQKFGKREHPPSIVIKFFLNSVKTKFLILSKLNKNNLKEIELSPGVQCSVFINEYLSPLKYSIVKRANMYRKEKKLFGVWTRNGKIFIRLEEKSQPIIIRSQEDLLSALNITQVQHKAAVTTEDDSDLGTDASVGTNFSTSSKKRKLRSSSSRPITSFLSKKEK